MAIARTIVFLIAVLLSACASAPRAMGSPEPVAPRTPALSVFESGSARFIAFNRLSSVLVRSGVVFFGEQHDDPETHAAELAVLTALGRERQRVVLSLEMFERDVQPLLDDYLAGRSSEAHFLANSRPWDRYASDYRPLVELAKKRGWSVIAANVPRRIASGVSRRGLAYLDSLSTGDRAYAARDISCPHDAYYDRFSQEMQSHGGVDTTNPATARATLDRYYESQCLKDETMAESITSAVQRAGAGAVVLHVNGSFHSDFRQGTAQRVLRRSNAARLITLTAVPVADPTQASGADYSMRADFVLFTKRTGQPSRLIGLPPFQ